MLDFSEAGCLHFNSFRRIDFKSLILNGILNLREHIITIPVNHLDRFAHLTARIGHFLFLAFFAATLVVVLRKRFGQYCNERTVSRQINSAFIFYRLILSLIRLSDSDVKPDECFARSGDTCHKANTLLLLFLTLFDDIQYVSDRSVSQNLVRLMPCDILDGVIFIQ